MLYTINYASISSKNLEALMDLCPEGAPVLFYEDGVYACFKGTSMSGLIERLTVTNPTYALIEDMEARGITSIVAGVEAVDYAGFVELEENHNVVPWLRN